MKKLVALAVGMTLCLAGSLALSKEHNRHGNNHHSKKNNKKQGHHDNGRHLAKGHHKFDTRDREITRTWCAEHRDRLPVGFRRGDRLAPRYESRLRVGVVLEPDLRVFIHPVPSDLLRRLPPPPVDIRYVAIGGHVGLVDHAHRLMDLLPVPPLP